MFRLAPVAAILWLAASPAAFAQIAPDALWDSWQDGTGFVSATGTATPEGDALVIDGARIDIGALRLEAETLRLVRDGDATRIDLPPDFTMAQGSITAQIIAEGLTLTASGDPENPTYALVAPQMDAALSGESTLADLVAIGVDATIAPDATTARMERLEVESLDAGFAVSRSGVDLQIDGPLDALTALAAGEAGPDVSVTLVAAQTTQDTVMSEGRGTVRVSTGPSREVAQATDGAVVFTQDVEVIDLALDTPALPIAAATMAIDSAALSLTGPAVVSEDASPTAFDLSLTDVTASEDLWQLFDPAGTLPRDPAQLRVATNGTAVRSSASQYKAQRIGLETLTLSVLGAELSGQGAVTLTRPDELYGRPVGTFAFTLTGVLGLLDRLQALGTVPGGPLVGARMGLGFFTRPGASADELVSTIKIGPDSIVTVNEQQVFEIPRTPTAAPAPVQ